ncbi:hypothetical protein [Hymenobacter sp. YC55]|uniref:hypothetical protein n=1 Tax=Hymenobacter sp. YC55 TaxID=3034019 RepID=UPI0023F99354|nr:hypothetical protein [Hymenobacter sp. YC55]MDF7810922.1 hypothetical protein [Hymenobacter sp. YC55]
MAAVYDLAELNRRAAAIREEETVLDEFFVGNVTHVTITAGDKTLTVEVSKRTSMGVVHELLLAAIEKREKTEKQMGSVRRIEQGGQEI